MLSQVITFRLEVISVVFVSVGAESTGEGVLAVLIEGLTSSALILFLYLKGQRTNFWGPFAATQN